MPLDGLYFTYGPGRGEGDRGKREPYSGYKQLLNCISCGLSREISCVGSFVGCELCDRRASSRVVLRVDVGVCGGGRTRRPEILRQGINALKFVESDTHFTRTR